MSAFFVISGYLITAILLRDDSMTPGNVLRFFIRRVARIYPMCLLQIALMSAAFAAFYPSYFSILREALPGLLSSRPERLSTSATR
jgi:peptidoglycan/LPS O-acetylase OafA/YrhL